MRFQILTLLTSLLLVSNSHAQSATISIDAPKSAKKSILDNISGRIDYTTSTNLDTPDSFEKTLENNLVLRLGYKIDEKNSLGSLISGVKGLTGLKEQKLENGFISYTNKTYESKYLNILSSARIYLPLDKEANDLSTYRTTLFAAPVFIVNLEKVAKGLTFTYRPAVSQRFHKFKQGLNGKANTQTSISHLFDIAYPISSKFNFGTYFVVGAGWTYNGNRKPTTYETAQELEYIINKRASISIGHIIGGNAQKANGLDNNINLFDENDSSVFSTLYYTF